MVIPMLIAFAEPLLALFLIVLLSSLYVVLARASFKIAKLSELLLLRTTTAINKLIRFSYSLALHRPSFFILLLFYLLPT
jgi:hypothetical protein